MIGKIEISKLPTPMAKVAARVNLVGDEASGDTFLMVSYVTEITLKMLGIALCAGIRKSSPTIAHKFEYALVRADGLGVWERMLGDCTGQSCVGYLDADLQPLVAWLTRKRARAEDEWAREAAQQCAFILELLGSESGALPRKLSVRFLLSQMVQIRNKTKAHGAVGPDFFDITNQKYLLAAKLLIDHCPMKDWQWYHLSVRPAKGTVRAIALTGPQPDHLREAKAETLRPNEAGVHFRTHERGHLFHCGDLLQTSRECAFFRVPNGGFTERGFGEYIDYSDGSVDSVELTAYVKPPAPLPPSATEGASALDIYSNVFGNLPPSPSGYVERPKLQDELTRRLYDKNHTIITLHGRGGIGKTSLALHVAHQLAAEEPPRFDHILWLSARDLELKPGGSTEVRRAIANADAVCRLVGQLFGMDKTLESFAALLQDAQKVDSSGILFVFDNFETLDDPRGMHEFLDTHTHIPNKVLITSRERAFKGDWPIEVGGMEFAEAETLLRSEARTLDIGHIVNASVVEDIYEYTDGHPYVMRVLLGEIAVDQRWVPLKSLVPRRGDLLNTVFERSFNKLSVDGRRVFLVVANWRSLVGELALLVVVGQRDLDVEAGIDECLRMSLVARYELADGQFCYGSPELARLFAKKKLAGDPDRLLIDEDLHLLRQFGTVRPEDAGDVQTQDMVDRFFDSCLKSAGTLEEGDSAKVDSVMLRVAELWPNAWAAVARFRSRIGRPAADVAYALRRAIEERPYDKATWLARAEHAKKHGDELTEIASLVSAVEIDPSDVELVEEAAFQLCRYLNERKSEIPATRRGVYVASVRSHMQDLADKLDATGLSRLAWLFLLEEDQENGWKYANMGLARDPTNRHCLKIVERLQARGYVPPGAAG